MFKIQEIRELIKLVDQSSIDEFCYEYENAKIKLKKNKETTTVQQTLLETDVVKSIPVVQETMQAETKETPAAPEKAVQPVAVEEANLHKIVSPMVGTFYQSPSPESPPYVAVGSKVSNETIVCIVEAMKLFNEIEADTEGEIVEILVKDGELVEYGQPLFLVKPN